MKAVYPPLSYALFIAISVVALSMILISMNLFTSNVQRNYARSQLDYVAELMRDDILELYSTNSNGTYQMPIPRDIAGKQYFIELQDKKVKLSLSIGDKTIETERLVNVSASLSGKSYAPVSVEMERIGGNTFIRLV